MDIQRKIKEAETYYRMGMLDESLMAYQRVLSEGQALDEAFSRLILKKTDAIKKEIRRLNQITPSDLSENEIGRIRAALPKSSTVKEFLDSADAFIELGLFREAARELGKIFEFDELPAGMAVGTILVKLAECLLKLYPAKEAVGMLMEKMDHFPMPPAERAQVRHYLARAAENGNAREMMGGPSNASENQKVSDDANVVVITRSKAIRQSDTSRYGYLLERQQLTAGNLREALEVARQSKKSVENILIEKMGIPKQEVGRSLSKHFRCPFKAYDPDVPVPVELIGKVKKAFLLNYLWVPLSWGKEGVEVLIDDPNDLRKTDHIKALMATRNIQFSVGIREDIVAFIERFWELGKEESVADSALGALDDLIPDVAFEEVEEDDEEGENIDESSSQVVKFVDQVLITAFRKKVSDIHIEPSVVTKKTTIRFRMDGVCQEYVQVPNLMAPGIMSRIKIMSNLDIAERRLPQDGKIKMKRKGVPEFELRVSTMPTAGGFEDAVLRILAKAGAMKLDDMGMAERNLSILKKIIVQPYGLILVVGPTGSGKTTTLHAALGHINKPEIKIWTAEDPVEITQPGLRQVEVKARIGLDFARVMRGFLRLDPDVIMIGEMRDHETAATGVEASLTGHLVFSTLHTNSAPETITRLLDMGLNPLNFSDAFLGVLAQRLIRRLCADCRETFTPDSEMIEEIGETYGAEAFERVRSQLVTDMIMNRPVGCDACSHAGYRGRMGIHELMEGTKAVKALIKEAAPTEKLFQQAFEDGMTTLKQDGIAKVFRGFSDMNEIRRVCID